MLRVDTALGHMRTPSALVLREHACAMCTDSGSKVPLSAFGQLLRDACRDSPHEVLDTQSVRLKLRSRALACCCGSRVMDAPHMPDVMAPGLLIYNNNVWWTRPLNLPRQTDFISP